MAEFGLTGGIGSGKSSVSTRLVALGAGLVDADAVVRELQVPGTAVFNAIVTHFGDGVVADDGSLDRPAIASIVFNDKAELEVLNGLVHPAVRDEMTARRATLSESGKPVVLDIPLLLDSEKGYKGLAGIIVVDVPVEAAVERLVAFRGFDEADARARMANQISREERLAKADFVVDNSGSIDDLDAEVDRCWSWIQQRSEDFGEISEKP